MSLSRHVQDVVDSLNWKETLGLVLNYHHHVSENLEEFPAKNRGNGILLEYLLMSRPLSEILEDLHERNRHVILICLWDRP